MTALRGYPGTLSSEQKRERFLSNLARYRDVSASSQNQAFNAILVFYRNVLGQPLGNVDALRAKRPVHARHAPTIGEAQLLLRTICNESLLPSFCPTSFCLFRFFSNDFVLSGRAREILQPPCIPHTPPRRSGTHIAGNPPGRTRN
jgi:hypothetical protein